MAVIHVKRNKNYTTMANYHLKDRRLTLKAKGLMSMMLSLPEDWDYSINGLAGICLEGKDAISAALKELRQYGYLIVEQKKDTTKYDFDYTLYEQPMRENRSGFSESGNPAQLIDNTTYYHTKDKTVHSVHSSPSPDGEVDSLTTLTQGGFAAVLDSFSVSGKKREAVLEFIKMRKLLKKPMTAHALELSLKKLDKMARTEEEQIAILEQSIANSWQGLFPLKDKSTSTDSATFEYEDLPKSFRTAYEDEGLQWDSSLPRICTAVVRLQQWYKEKREDLTFAEKNARSNWSSLTFSAKTFWKSFLEYMYNVIGDNPPQPAHFDPKGNMFGSWAREMEIKL